MKKVVLYTVAFASAIAILSLSSYPAECMQQGPATFAGQQCQIENYGCPMDSDGDGVFDGMDICFPDNPPPVGTKGWLVQGGEQKYGKLYDGHGVGTNCRHFEPLD